MTHPTLHAFLRELVETGTYYSLSSARDGAVIVHVMLSDEHWEVRFFDDREPEVEIFRSDGTIFALENVNVPAADESK